MENVSSYVIDRKALVSFRSRWEALSRKRSLVDFEVAQFANELRQVLPDTPSGDRQFIEVCINDLHMAGTRARILATSGKAYRCGFQNGEEWELVGGWPTISFLMGLRPADRKNIMRKTVARATELGRAVTSGVARKFAHEAGCVPKLSRGGRPRHSDQERRIGTLRGWLQQLYQKHPNLPKMPAEVAEAMRTNALATVMQFGALKKAA